MLAKSLMAHSRVMPAWLAGSALLIIVCLYQCSFVHTVCAGIITTGDIEPSNPTTWTSSTRAYIGDEGNATMYITPEIDIVDKSGHIGHGSKSTGEVTVDGLGSTWTNDDKVVVGYRGSGKLDIAHGGAVNDSVGYIGYDIGSTGEVIVDGAGSTWWNAADLVVGYSGHGELTITNGGIVVVAGTLVINDFPYGNNVVNMASGGSLAIYGEADDSLADFLALVDGSDAIRYKIFTTGDIYRSMEWPIIREEWADITEATYGEDYTLCYLTEGDLAGYTVLKVGVVPEPPTLAGLIGLCLGGLLALARRRCDGVAQYRQKYLAGYASVCSAFFIIACLYLCCSAQTVYAKVVQSGDISPSNPYKWTASTTAYIGQTGSATLIIYGGSGIRDKYGYIGCGSDSTGEVAVVDAGSMWTNNDGLFVGSSGSGTLNIINGGKVSDTYGRIGNSTGSQGVVTVYGPGAMWTNDDKVYVGYKGNGKLDISHGWAVSDKYGYIGYNIGSTGEVSVDGIDSTWTHDESLYVGRAGGGTMDVTGGGTVCNRYGLIGFDSGSTGEVIVDGVGSTWWNAADLAVGYNGHGELTITNGGMVVVAGTLVINYFGDGNDVVNMASGGTLAIYGEADDSLAEFLAHVDGTDAIRYKIFTTVDIYQSMEWPIIREEWADITEATYGRDYTLSYQTSGDLAGYTLLTIVPEPSPLAGLLGLVMMGVLTLVRRKR